jgi:hypothetical protein
VLFLMLVYHFFWHTSRAVSSLSRDFLLHAQIQYVLSQLASITLLQNGILETRHCGSRYEMEIYIYLIYSFVDYSADCLGQIKVAKSIEKPGEKARPT